jgi:fibronectin type 3 domain-containing protein
MVRAQGDYEVFGVTSFTTNDLVPVITAEDISSSYVKLSISSLPKNAKVTIYRGTKSKELKKLATVKNKTTYTDKKVKSAKTYYYRIKVSLTLSDGTTKTVKSKKIKVKTLKNMGLPSVSGKTKTYAYYTAVTVKSSPQYKLLNSEDCYTDEETGIRMVDGCYCIALGSYYGSKIGTKYKITLSSGESFMAILCDQKANRHTDSKNQYAVRNSDVVEFYVEKGKIPKGVNGDYGKLEQFKGSIAKIEKYVG